MKKIAPWLLLPLALLAFFLFFFKPTPPRHIFLITLDTTRADALDYAIGNTRTPNLAALAASGVRFDNAYSVIPITSPSHAAMFYSMPPHVLKVFNNGQKRETRYPPIAEIMKQKGYATGAIVSLAVFMRSIGLTRGFDHYLDHFRPGLWYRSAAEVNRDAFSLIEKLKGGKSFVWIHYSDPHEPYSPPGPVEKFTVSLNGQVLYSGPSIEQPILRLPLILEPGKNIIHLNTELPSTLAAGDFRGVAFSNLDFRALEPVADITLDYSPDMRFSNERYKMLRLSTEAPCSFMTVINKGSKPCRAELSFKYQIKISNEAKRKGYERELHYLDAQIGVFLDHLKKVGLYDESIFLVMGDHGEGLGEYGSHFGHIHFLNKVYTHVPFFVSGKSIRRRGVSHGLVSNFSVAPTLLSLAGIKKPKYMTGGDALEVEGTAKLLLETYSPEAYFDAFSVVYFPWQIVFYPGRTERRMEFFNLEKDRFGTVDLHAEADPSGQRAEMTKSVLEISRIITASKHKQGALNQKTMDILKSLGYL